jgi:hypothetical protein
MVNQRSTIRTYDTTYITPSVVQGGLRLSIWLKGMKSAYLTAGSNALSSTITAWVSRDKASCRYLLVEFLTAEVLSQTRQKESHARLMSIALACRHHQSFLKRLQKFDLVPKSVGMIMDRLEHGEKASPLVRPRQIPIWGQQQKIASRDGRETLNATHGRYITVQSDMNCVTQSCLLGPRELDLCSSCVN